MKHFDYLLKGHFRGMFFVQCLHQWQPKVPLITRKALGGDSEGTERTLGHLRHLGTRALRALRHLETWALRVLRYLGTWPPRTLRHLGTRALKALGHSGS